jgi:methyltransferase (TIGR00027 family)
MSENNMTALICAFSRAYHSKVNKVKIYDDFLAEEILTEEEYKHTSENMSNGIQFFNPDFRGSKSEALRWVVDNYLSPTPLGRAIFNETALKKAVDEGISQYVILGSGYDSFSYRHVEWAKALSIFELDRAFIISDKQKRLLRIGLTAPSNTSFIPVDFTDKSWINALKMHEKFDHQRDCFISLLGVSYYLSENDFLEMVDGISKLTEGRLIMVFDYPDEETYTERAGERAKKQLMLAKASGAEMLSCYSITQIDKILHLYGFVESAHLKPEEITSTLFEAYNQSNAKHHIKAFDNVNYCIAIKAKES